MNEPTKPSEQRPEHPDFWCKRFGEGVTPWDAGRVQGDFASFVAARAQPLNTLIPGCGSAWEASHLADHREQRVRQHEPFALDQSYQRAQRQHPRPVRRRSLALVAPPDDHPRPTELGFLRDLLRETRLADAGITGDQDESARARLGRCERAGKLVDLAGPTDEETIRGG